MVSHLRIFRSITKIAYSTGTSSNVMNVATAKPADLRVAERLPQRAAMESEREQRQHRCTDGDHHGTQPDDACVDYRFFERFALFVFFFDEVEEHDDVAHDHADQTGDAEKGHESEGSAHDPQCCHGADHSVRRSCKHQQRLHRAVELEDQCQKDAEYRSAHYDRKLAESPVLLVIIAAHADLVTRGK